MANRMGESISIVDKSGKVISTGKTLLSLFKEAKDAYHTRKSELHSSRRQKAIQTSDRRTRLTLEDSQSRLSDVRSSTSRRSSRSHRHRSHTHHNRSRRLSDVASASPSLHSDLTRPHSSHSADEPRSPRSPRSPRLPPPSYADGATQLVYRSRPSRAQTEPVHTHRHDEYIDMSLAYGDMPPSHLVSPRSPSRPADAELAGLVSRFDFLMDEAHCVQHSVTTIIKSLQQNPDAMAAVALTLAEISNVISKVGPGVLTTLKASSPSIVALLASPQFLIAAGVGVGVTIIAFGGYKIVKRIQAKSKAESGEDELQEIGSELSRIEVWRRGIEDARGMSVGTSVDGEFITPRAAEMRRAGTVVSQAPTTGREGGVERPRERERRHRDAERDARSVRTSTTKSERKERPVKERGANASSKEKEKKKRSPLSVLFRKSHRQPQMRVIEM